MSSTTIVQFVRFETTLDTCQFIPKWEQYIRSAKSDVDVTMHQSENNGGFRYVSQHHCTSDEFQFIFTKSGRVSRIPEVEVKIKQAGGYLMIQTERKNDVHNDECKILVFLNNPQTDLNVFRKLAVHSKLNIYEAYYENCKYSYILEYFVKNKYVAEYMENLKQYETTEVGVYKECLLQAV